MDLYSSNITGALTGNKEREGAPPSPSHNITISNVAFGDGQAKLTAEEAIKARIEILNGVPLSESHKGIDDAVVAIPERNAREIETTLPLP